MISAPTRIEATNVDAFVSLMTDAYDKDRERPLSIDMSNVEAISRPAGAVLVNALLTELAQATIALVEPARSPVEKLTYSGLGFAFAHREGRTQFQRLTEKDLFFDRWKIPWTPAKQTASVQTNDDRATSEPDAEDPSFIFRAHAAFVNPHATSRRHFRRDIPYRVQGWLQHVLPLRAMGIVQAGLPSFVEELQSLIYEVVDNVAEHAWPQNSPEPVSLVQISVARGGERDTRDRIWLIVLDTGPGIAATAAPKINEPGLPPQDLLQGLLDGRFLQSKHRARGLGLPRVARICKNWRDSHLSILNDEFRITLTDGVLQTTKTDRKMRGTLIVARFATPPVPADV